ncbi:hypothetical protein PSV09DRAFT_1197875, partial [Bipolaris maydis]
VKGNPSNRPSQALLATDSIHSLRCHRALPMHSSFLCPHILAFLGWCLVAAFHAHPIGSPAHPLLSVSVFLSIRATLYHTSMLLVCKGCGNILHRIWGLHPS